MNNIVWSDVAEKHITTIKQPLPYQVIGKLFTMMTRVSLTKSSQWFQKVWFKPFKGKINKKDQAWLDSAQVFYANYKGKLIPVYKWGQGPSIWCVHGWSGHSGQFRQIGQNLIEAGYSVLSFDAPAHGHSEGKRTNIVDIGEFILLLNRAFGHPHGIIAHSAGGLAVNYALQSGLETQKTIFINTPLSVDYVIDISQFQMDLPRDLMNAHRNLIEERFGEQVWDLLSMESFQERQPALFFYDHTDDQVSPKIGSHLQGLFKHSTFEFSDGLGHNRILREESKVQTIKAFIANQDNVKG